MARKPAKAAKDRVTLHYIKGPQCAEIPVHGAFGGIEPATGRIFMSVFSERRPIPKEQIIEQPAEGGSPEIKKTVGRKGVIRSVNSVLHFDINTALSLHEWLGRQIEEFQKAHPDFFDQEVKK